MNARPASHNEFALTAAPNPQGTHARREEQHGEVPLFARCHGTAEWADTTENDATPEAEVPPGRRTASSGREGELG